MPRRLGRSHAAQLALSVLFCASLAGCGTVLAGEDPGPPPDPMASDVVDARVVATNAADAALADAAAALDGQIVTRTSADACYRGQNNYKVHDGYDHRCTLRRAVVVAFDGDFRDRIALFDERLFAAGWGCYFSDPCSETLSGLVEEYWDFRKPEYGGNDPPISVLPTPSSYQRDGLYLDVDYVSPDRSGRRTLEDWHRRRRGGLFESFEQSRPFDVDATLARVTRFDYAVALAIETDYYEDTEIG